MSLINDMDLEICLIYVCGLGGGLFSYFFPHICISSKGVLIIDVDISNYGPISLSSTSNNQLPKRQRISIRLSFRT